MNRIARIALSMSLSLTAIGTYAGIRYGAEAITLGAENRYYAELVDTRVARHPKGRWVAWLGDSTMRPRPDLGVTSYPIDVGNRLRPLGIGNWDLTLPGLDPIHYYFLMSPVLDMQPDLLILAATMRTLQGPAPESERNYLCAFMSPRLIPEAVTLPFYSRGLTIPDLLACPSLGAPAIRRGILFIDGLRRLFSESDVWGAVDYPREPPTLIAAKKIIGDNLTERYKPPLTHNTPTVKILGAVVEEATSRGIPTLVVIGAIPIDLLMNYGLFDAEIINQRINVISDVVERAGGMILDLHDSIPASEMRDNAGHLNQDGIKHVSDILEPTILQILDSTEPPAAGRP